MNHKYNTIIRIQTNNGNFATITNKIIYNDKLSSDAKILLIAILNKSQDWDINLEFYAQKFGLPLKRITKAVSNLTDNGFLSRKRKGKLYIYTVSEYGNLSSQPAIEELANEPAIEVTTESVLPTPVTPEQEAEFESVLLNQVITKVFSSEEIGEIYGSYASKFKKLEINSENFNINTIKKEIYKNYKNKFDDYKKVMNEKNLALEFAKKYNEQNPKGTIAQQKAITSRFLDWLNDEINDGNIPTEYEIISEHKRIRNNITTANRIVSGND